MPTWVKVIAIVMVLVMFGIPALLLGMMVNLWFFLLLFGLIFIPVILLRPAVEESRR
jgi:hypothetical protein